MNSISDRCVINSSSSFNTIDEARKKIVAYCQISHSVTKVKTSSRNNYHVVCKSNDCPFQITVNKRKDGLYHICKFNVEHSCLNFEQPAVKTSFIVNLISLLVEENPNILPATIRDFTLKEYGIEIPYSTAFRAKGKVLEERKVKEEDSFKKIGPYFNALTTSMPGTIAVLERSDLHFVRTFLCLRASQISFRHCIPIVFLDVYAIENCYKGVIMAAGTLDGDGQFVLLAFGACSTENGDNWAWFIQNLHSSIPEIEEVSVLSHGDKGLYNAVKDNLPNCKHFFCIRYVAEKLKAKFKVNFGEDLLIAAKTFNSAKFNEAMQKMTLKSKDAVDYLLELGVSSWTCIHSPVPRFGHVTSNVSEFLKSWMSSAVEISHFKIHVAIVRKMMSSYAERRQYYSTVHRVLPRSLTDELRRHAPKIHKMRVIPSSDVEGMVIDDEREYAVHLGNSRCSCGFLSHMGRPCAHAVAFITLRKGDLLQNISKVFFIDSLKAIYEPVIRAIITCDLPMDDTLPPTTQAQVRMLKDPRLRNRSRLTNDNSPVACSICGLKGHNKLTCLRRQRGERVYPY